MIHLPNYSQIAAQLPTAIKAAGMDAVLDAYLTILENTKKPYFRWTVWQRVDLHLMLNKTESCIIRSRRGGKSRDLAVIAVFFSLIGMDIIWLAAQSDQLAQARKYLLANPFCIGIKKFEVKTLGSGSFDLSMITKGRSASRGADVLIFDEGGKINVNLLEYEYYSYARAMVAEKTTGFYRIINASTPCLASAIEEVYRDLLVMDPGAISVHPYTDCYWISPTFVADEERRLGKWYVDQEYRALFVPHGGALLNNIVICDSIPDFSDVDKSWGIDLNITVALGSIMIVGDDCYVCDEMELDWFKKIEKEELEQRLAKIAVEMESDGFNYYQARTWATQYSHLIYVEWSKENKGARLAKGRQFKNIFVDPKRTPRIYADLSSAISHPTENIWLKDIRHPSHWTDVFFHAVGAGQGRVYAVGSGSQPKGLVPSWRKKR